MKFSNDKPVDQINDNDISRFINELSKNYQQWQVDQAAQAIQIYLFYKRDDSEVHVIQSNNTDEQWKTQDQGLFEDTTFTLVIFKNT